MLIRCKACLHSSSVNSRRSFREKFPSFIPNFSASSQSLTLLYSKDRGIYENATKTGDTRFLKLPTETMELLKDYRQYWLELRFKNGDRWQGGEYVFVKDDGSVIHPDSLTAYLNRFSKQHPELPHINPHAFRHTVASVLINSGQDIVTVSRRLGHSRTSTTLDVYSHLIAEADADASEVIADALLRRRA